jgi:hypothetical protein
MSRSKEGFTPPDTVGELIEYLQSLDPTMKVRSDGGRDVQKIADLIVTDDRVILDCVDDRPDYYRFGHISSYRRRGLCGYPLGGSNPGTCAETINHDVGREGTPHVSDGKRH